MRGKGIEGAKAARLECTCCGARDSERAPLYFLTLLPHSRPQVLPHRHAVGALSAAASRFRASAGDAGMSILLAGVVVWISAVGPVGMAVAAGLGWHYPDLVQIRMHCLCPDLGGMLPPPPLLPLPRPALGRVQRGLEGIWYCRHCRCCFSGGLPAPH